MGASLKSPTESLICDQREGPRDGLFSDQRFDETSKSDHDEYLRRNRHTPRPTGGDGETRKMSVPRVKKILAKCAECGHYFWSYVAYSVDGSETFEQVDSLNLCSDCTVKNREPLGKKPSTTSREQALRRKVAKLQREHPRQSFTKGLFDE